ncbi:MAG: YggS family pyridoxal phosphate-dependent enzyme [Planctomycetaceae bacterium]
MNAERLQRVLKENLGTVHEHIQQACARVGRKAEEVHLVAVTKYAPWETVLALYELGITHFGESRPQQLVERAELIPSATWHLIGHLQRNKVRPVLEHSEYIHSIDSARLLERVSNIAEELGVTPKVLLEVNVSGEGAKDGFSPAELQSAWTEIAATKHVELAGLMTMAPYTDDTAVIRNVFSGLRNLRNELQATSGHQLPHLSMGMSSDYEIAIEEGATLIRLGSCLFEGIED